MATKVSIASTYAAAGGTDSAQRGYVGYYSGKNWVMRYAFKTPSAGYTTSLTFRSYWYSPGSFSAYPVRAYVTTSSTSHLNAGSGSTYQGTMVAETSGDYNVKVALTGLMLPPATTHYLYLFPGYTSTYRHNAHNANAGQSNILSAEVAAESTLTVGNGTLGTAQTLTVTKQVSNYTHTITYTCGTATGTICTKSSSTSISFTPPLDLASQNVTGTSVPVTFAIQTYRSGVAVGSEKTKTVTMAIPATVKPDCHITVEDATGFADRFGGYVQGRSKAEITVSATLAYGSAIQNKTYTFDGNTYTKNGTTPAISNSGTLEVAASVTDGRGRTGAATTSVSVLPYTPPAVTKLTVGRCDASGTANDTGAYAKVTYSYSITALSNQNDKSATLQYKKTSASAWTTVALTSAYSATDATYIFAADDGSSYDVRLNVIDYFEQTSRSTTVSTAEVIMHFNASGNAIAFGKISEKANAIEMGWKAYDQFGAAITNGLAEYTGSGTASINPNTTTDSLILTNNGTPTAAFYFVQTFFYNSKDTGSNKAQLATPYNASSKGAYYRYQASGTWSAWEKLLVENDAMAIAYPVGSTYIADDASTDPAELYGGTWELYDKEFAPAYTNDSTLFTASSNVASYSLACIRGGHSIFLAASFSLKAEASETAVDLGTFNFAKLGITSQIYGIGNTIGGSDAGNCVVVFSMNTSGQVSLTDVVGKNSGTIAANSAFRFLYETPLHHTYMLDSFCNKFYWRRTA